MSCSLLCVKPGSYSMKIPDKLQDKVKNYLGREFQHTFEIGTFFVENIPTKYNLSTNQRTVKCISVRTA